MQNLMVNSDRGVNKRVLKSPSEDLGQSKRSPTKSSSVLNVIDKRDKKDKKDKADLTLNSDKTTDLSIETLGEGLDKDLDKNLDKNLDKKSNVISESNKSTTTNNTSDNTSDNSTPNNTSDNTTPSKSKSKASTTKSTQPTTNNTKSTNTTQNTTTQPTTNNTTPNKSTQPTTNNINNTTVDESLPTTNNTPNDNNDNQNSDNNDKDGNQDSDKDITQDNQDDSSDNDGNGDNLVMTGKSAREEVDGELLRVFQSTLSGSEGVQGVDKLLNLPDEMEHVRVAWFLALSEQRVLGEVEERVELDKKIEELRTKVLLRSDPRWHRAVRKAKYTVDSSLNGPVSVAGVELLISTVIETLIRTSSVEIDRAVDLVLGNSADQDPRVVRVQGTDVEIVDEILESLARLPIAEIKKRIVSIAGTLGPEHIETILSHLSGDLGRLLPTALFVHNQVVYDLLEREFFKRYVVERPGMVEYFPRIDIEAVIKSLHRTSAMFRSLETIARQRPIHRARIVDEICSYIKKGARTKCVVFVKDNLSLFTDRIDDLGLSCEELLLLAEKRPELLQKVFIVISELKTSLKEKRQQNHQKKEKRLSSLIAVTAAQLGSLPEETVEQFILEGAAKDPDLLARLCLGLFRLQPPGPQVRRALAKLAAAGSPPALVFAALPYLEDQQRLRLVKRYLVDDVSLVLFLRVVRPEDLLVHAHGLEADSARRIIKLCLQRPEAFPDRTVSLALAQMEEFHPLPELFVSTVEAALEAFPNMKPFIVTLIRRTWERLFTANPKGTVRLLERLEAASPELLLSFSEAAIREVLATSEVLRDRLETYLRKQPKYIQSKYADLAREAATTPQ
ncbi:hypothetical protein NEHOM01_0522 [Nematocida homosporus]|uniref:uncharacterized protein n=1 Tax=Nematocida homosporus TaxID=1912981 RepID=UPI002220F91E|nr:uncharacterized protein NEHOM01_0522 [Nematocida homosporus]KAI5184971.1 hypothetical protein NEHOM01_0522 [Nematocida homosporus]